MATKRIEEWADGVLLNVSEVEVPDEPPVAADPVMAVAETIKREVSARLDSSASTNAKIRAAINDGLAAAVESLRAGQ